MEPAAAGANGEGDQDDAFYSKMFYYRYFWNACAGPCVTLPVEGERLYYFPQGHIEQLGVPLDELRIPSFNLPSQILCRVINVQRKVEAETDELYAQITLLPELDQTDITSYDQTKPECPEQTVHSFWKTLTTSDLRTPECLYIDSVHAETCFPPLNMSQLEPWQDLVVTDINGKDWHFRHIVKGDPMCHLLTTGWSEFASSKRLYAGDSLIFLSEENGKLRVGVKTPKQLPTENKLSCIVPIPNPCIEVLASVSHAPSAGSLFTVLYKPRKSQSRFIVEVNSYLQAQQHKFSIGMRFSMRLEADEVSVKSSLCTIVDIGDISQKWSNSKWRCLKVSWDRSEGLSVLAPERVSPWELEPVIAEPDHGMWIFPVDQAPNLPYNDHLHSSSNSPTTSNTNSRSFSDNISASASQEQLENDAESVHSVVDECSTQSLDATASDNISDGSNNSRSAIPSKSCELEEDSQSNRIRTRIYKEKTTNDQIIDHNTAKPRQMLVYTRKRKKGSHL